MKKTLKDPKKETYVQKLVKQGNSLCVRVPFDVAKRLKTKEGDIMIIELTNAGKLDIPDEILKCYGNIPGLNEYSLNKIKKYIFLMGTQKSSGKNLIKDKEYKNFKKIAWKNRKVIAKAIDNTVKEVYC